MVMNSWVPLMIVTHFVRLFEALHKSLLDVHLVETFFLAKHTLLGDSIYFVYLRFFFFLILIVSRANESPIVPPA